MSSSTHPLVSRFAFPRANRNPFIGSTYILSSVCALLSALLLLDFPLLSLLVAALLCGWSETDGLCGTSHVSSLTPLRRIGSSGLWWRAVTAYTSAGTVTAAASGVLVGSLGTIAGMQELDMVGAAALTFAMLLLVARECGWLRFRLPQVKLQTVKIWARDFGWVPAAGMWGAHIGIGFATVIKHGGYFMLLPAALLLGPLKGAALMATYWLGRTLAMWITPLLIASAFHGNGNLLGRMVADSGASFRWAAVTGLVCGTAASMLLFVGVD